jgi:hypothetical protein
MLNILFIAVLFPLNSLFASTSDCTYSVKSESVTVKWEAYKTPAKAGVSGQFQNFELVSQSEGKSIMEIVKGSKFKINSQKIHTRDPGRDEKIAKFFFSSMSGGVDISGEVKDIVGENLLVAITMNGKTVEVPMSFSERNGNFKANGHLDVFDFAMHSQLQAINEACKALHQGKTWNDVGIEVAIQFKKKCK